MARKKSSKQSKQHKTKTKARLSKKIITKSSSSSNEPTSSIVANSIVNSNVKVPSSNSPSSPVQKKESSIIEKLSSQIDQTPAEELKRKREAIEQRKLIQKDIKKQATQTAVNSIKDDHELVLVKPKKAVHKSRPLKDWLPLAGFETVEPKTVVKRIFLAAVISTMLITIFTLVIAYAYNNQFNSPRLIGSYLVFTFALWTAVFAGFLLLYGACFAVYLDLRINKRCKQVEEVFPDFLQLAAANLSAGMTVDRALWSAIRPRFGVLAKEMEDVAKKTMTGYDIERALTDFGNKYNSITMKRSLSLITEGIRSGGRMADILNKIAVNMQENAILQKEMAANVTTYVIFISFASIVAAPFLFGLATQLLIVIKSIAAQLGGQGGSSTLGIHINPDAASTSDFRIFAMVTLSVTSLMSACIVSVIRKGTIKDGLRLLPFFWITSMVLYTIATTVLGLLFSNIV